METFNLPDYQRPKVKRGHVHYADRQFVYDRDGYCCLKCREKDNLTIDHIVPLVRGGKNHVSNYQTLCNQCNREKGEKCTDYRWNEEPNWDAGDWNNPGQFLNPVTIHKAERKKRQLLIEAAKPKKRKVENWVKDDIDFQRNPPQKVKALLGRKESPELIPKVFYTGPKVEYKYSERHVAVMV